MKIIEWVINGNNEKGVRAAAIATLVGHGWTEGPIYISEYKGEWASHGCKVEKGDHSPGLLPGS
jgi:hypothetical protein